MKNQNPFITLGLIGTLLCAPALAQTPTAPSAVSPAAAEAKQEGNLARITRNLEKEQQHAQLAIERERAELNALELDTKRQAITALQLEQARLDAAAVRSQRNSLGSRLLSRRDTLRDIEADIDRLNERLNNGGDAAVIEPQIAELRQQRQSVEVVMESLTKLQRLLDTRLWLARQQLSVLQNRFELPDLSSITRPPSPREQQLRNEMDDLLADASDLRIQAATITEELTALQTGRPLNSALHRNEQLRWLSVQAQVAEERAELRQQTLKLLRAEQILNVLSGFPGAQSTPVRVLESGVNNLQELCDNLDAQAESLRRRRSLVADQIARAERLSAVNQAPSQKPSAAGQTNNSEAAGAAAPKPEPNQRVALLTELRAELNAQADAYAAAIDSANTILSDYQRVIGERSQTALLERNAWPADSYAWRSLGASLTKLPARVLRDFIGAGRRLISGFQRVLAGDDFVPLLVVLGVIALSVPGYRWLWQLEKRRPFDAEAAELGRSLREPLRILRRNYLLLLVPLIAAVAGWQLGLNVKSLTLLVTPLLIWPVVTVSMAFVEYFMRTYTPDISREDTTKLLKMARWVIAFTAVLAACLTIARTVALSPLVTNAIESLSMVCLLIIALPLIKLRGALIGKNREYLWQPEVAGNSIRSKALRIGTGILVFTLVASAVVGLAGYVNLSWAIARYVGVLVLIGMGWLMLRSLLRDFIDSWHRRTVQRDPDTAAFWRQCVLAPTYGLLVIALTVAAGFLIYWLLGWNSSTPIVRSLPKLFNYTLFEVKGTAIKFSNFFAAAVIVFMVFRAASWSRQVSYRFALQKVQDVGIRNSLSTFIQYTVVVAGLLIAIRTIGLDLTALTVFAGALGVGIGFGLQQIVVNFISGILLLIERPLSTSDLVNVDKYEGEVTHIGIRSLTVKTWDAQEVIIPNSAVITKPFTNWTRSDDTMRTVLMVGISYDDDPKKAIELITDIVVNHPAVLAAPAPKVLLWEYADSALTIRVQLFSRIRGDIGRVDMRSQLLLAIREGLIEAGMSIPFPQRDVHLVSGNLLAKPSNAHTGQPAGGANAGPSGEADARRDGERDDE